MKMNRELLWKKHEMIQAQFKEWERWYDDIGVAILELDEKRQKIAQKYFQFEHGKLKVNQQQQHVLLKGKDMRDYDKEMAVLMSGEEEIDESVKML